MNVSKFYSNLLFALALVAVIVISSLPLTLSSPSSTPIIIKAGATTIEVPREESLVLSGVPWGGFHSFNPYSWEATWGIWGAPQLYAQLFYYSFWQDAWLPFIAEGYQWVSNDTLRVFIRPEAKWSDGTPITAYDVEFTYKLSLELGNGPGIDLAEYVEYIKAIDDKTVEVKMKPGANNYFAVVEGMFWFIPVPKHVFEPLYKEMGANIREWKNDDPEKQVVSGPYKLMYTDYENVAIYERIDDWWGKDIFGLPRPKYIIIRHYKDLESVIIATIRGDVDQACAMSRDIPQHFKDDLSAFYEHPPYHLPSGPLILWISYRNPELANPVIRKAIAYAIPYKEILDKAYYNGSDIASISLVVDYYERNQKYINRTLCEIYWGTPTCKLETNLELANRILDEAGYKRDPDGIRRDPNTGKRLEGYTIMIPSGWSDWMTMAELIAENLRKIGLGVETEYPDPSVVFERIGKGEFDFTIMEATEMPGASHPWLTYRVIMDSRLTAPYGEYAIGDYERYNNTEVNKLLDEAAKYAMYPDKLVEIYSKIQEIYYRDLPVLPTVYVTYIAVYNVKYWVNWPSEDNPWWAPPALWHDEGNPTLFGLVKRGETPKIPDWLKPIDEGGLLIPYQKVFDDLRFVVETGQSSTPVRARPTPTTSPPTTSPSPTTSPPAGAATTVTTTYTTTRTETYTKTTTMTVVQTDWTTTAVLAIVLFIIGFAIAWFARGRK